MSESIPGDGDDVRGKVSALMARLREKKEAALPTRIQRVARDGGVLALSSGQLRLWFIEQLQPGNVAYNITGVVRLRGRLDAGALRSCCAEIVRRHEILRTSFQPGENGPVQIVAPAETLPPFPLPLVDVSGLPDGEGQVAPRAREDAAQAFDLARGPLLRTTLIRLGVEEHCLLLAVHHIVSDGWSLAVLLNEARVLYEAFLAGRPSPLPELPIQYADYSAWQRRWLESPASEQQLAYWRRQLAAAPDLLQLPADRPRPAVRTSRGGTHFFAIPAELRDALLAQGREEGVTPFVVLLAAYAALLHRLSGQTDVLIGSPVANRRRAEVQGLIGFFVSTLVLRVDLSGAVSFRELLRRLHGVVLDAFEHQDLPFDRLVGELQPQRLLSQTPLFQVAFALQNVPLPAWELAGLELSPVRVDTGTSMFDLTLYLKDSPERLEGWFEYAADLFDAATVARHAGNFETLIAGVAAGGDRRLAEIGVLTAAERRQIAQWNAAPAYPASNLLHRRIEAQAARAPQRLAVDLDGQSLSYGELNARANGLARHLRRLGVGPNVAVGVCLERSPDLIAALLGVLKAGGVYVPLDPAYPSERWGSMLRDARIAVLLSQQSLLPRLPAPDWQVLCLDREGEWLAAGSGEDLPPAAGLDDLLYVIYTSGSTGRPKGAAVYQRSFLNLLDWYLEEFAVDAGDSFLLLSSVSFDLTQKGLFAPLLTGGRLQLAPPGPYDPAVLIGTIERERITRLNCTPSAFYPLVERDEAFPRLASLRSLSLGGEPISLARLERWRDSPYCGAQIVNTYGPTECTDIVSFHRLPAPASRAAVPIGRPVPGCRLWVLGPGLEPVPAGVAGQLCIGGACVGAGYLRDAAATAEKFFPDPFSGVPGSRLYQTGDLARWLAGGDVEYLGRADHQVKVRGFRIELGEIEAVLEGHPGVVAAIVLARPAPGDGNGDLRLVGYLVPAAGKAGLDAGRLLADVRTWVRERLPEYMVPAAWVLLDELPLTPSGKVDRKALPAPEGGVEEAGRPAFVAPRTPTEEVLALIWAELLGTGRVGVTESFFELGGHSLLGTQMVSRVRDAFGLELPVRALFEAPTVEALAARIDAGRQESEGSPAPPLAAAERPGTGAVALPLSFAQQRLWFLHQLAPGSAAYHIPAAIRLAGALDPAALAGALGEVVRRHETLRTTFGAAEDEAVQVVAPPAPPGTPRLLPQVDLSALPEASREAETLRLAAGEVARPFDLGHGPLLRSLLLRLGGREHALLLVVHHIVSDGWSMGVLVGEAVAAYRALARRPPSLPSLPPLPVQYGDFVLWQRSWLQGEALERQLRFWRRHLAAAPAVLELPTDRPRTGPGRLGGRVPLRLAPAATARLKALARRESATLFMALLGGYCALLERYSGQSDLVVGTPIANRTRPEIEPLIGLFVNTLALRTTLDGGESPRALLRRVRSSALDAYAHQDVPFERLVEELAPERHLDHTPLFQVMLTLQNAPGGSTDLPGLRITPLEAANTEAKFDWTLTVWEEDGGLQGTLGYRSELWDEPAARRVLGHLERLLVGLAESPDGRLDELPLLGEAERRQLLDGGMESCREWGGPASVHGLFEAQAARVPDAPAVVFEDRGLSYAELNARANAVARRLRGLGVGPEVPVALCLERSLEVIVALLGVLKAGGAYLPLDPRLPRERVRQMLAGARAPVAIATEGLRALLPQSGLRILPIEETGTGEGLANPGFAAAPEQLAYVLFTSGSTGTPRGVGVEHRQLLNYVHGILERLDLAAVESFATVSTLAADLGNTSLFPALLTGRCLHVISEERLGHPEAMADYLDRHRVDVLKIVPSHLLALATPARPAGPLPRRFLVLGGEASFRDHAERLRAAAPECVLLNHYGPTETTVGVLTHRWQPGEAGSGGVLPLGRPLANSRVYVLDAAGRLLPAGVPGELWIGGAGVSRGYLHQPGRTAERFLPDPWSGEPGARLYRTGDLVRRRPDGVIEFLGRIDHQVKIRGFRIELGEIEATLERHPAVRESVVLAREDRPGERRLAAYVVGDEVSASELRGWLGERLPDYALPADFVFLGRLPFTPNGKVDRRALPAPAEILPALPAAGGAPASSLAEELLLELFAEVLRAERVAPAADFFALGGHSLLATQLMSRVRRAFGVEVPLRALFEEPTPAGLARRIDGIVRAREGRPAPPLRPVPREPGLPLSFAQQRLWFLYQMDPGSSSYNVPRAVRLAGELRPEALEAALAEVLRRHEVLRTSFPVVSGRPALAIRPARPESLPRIDLSALPEARREAEAWRLAEAEARRPFDLARGPLVRNALVRLGGGDHVLLFNLHHIVSDGWSTGVLVREVGALYQAFRAGAPSPLPELPIQYADFAHWQRRWLSGEVLEEQLAYWRRQLAGLPDGLDLPFDRERPATPSLAGGLRSRVFPAELRLALHRLGRGHGTTFFMTMLAVFAALLHRLSRQDDVVMGTSIANRNRVEIEGLIGFFVNTLVLRLDASQGPAFVDFLAQAREVALGAGTHQDLPFERLVEDLAPERNLGRTPLFQVMFVVQNAPAEELRLPGLAWSLLPVETRTANFDLTLRLFETARGLEAGLEFKRALFDDATVDRLLGHLETLAGSAVSQPGDPITRLPLLSAEEWRQLAREPLAAHRPFPVDACLHRLFERQAARSPGNVAAVCGGERLTYAALNARADALAARLRRLGVGPEVRVALWLDRSLELVVAILGVLKAGGAYVPLDPLYPRERLRFLLADAGAPVLVSVRELLARLGPQDVETVLLDELGEEAAVSSPGLPDSTAYVIYTSGSTGTPKGVPVSHANVVRLFTATEEWFGFGERDVWTLFHSYAFDFSVWELWGALLHGGRLVVVPYWISRSPEAFYSLLVAERVTVLNQTPSAFHQLAAFEEEPGRQGELALRWVIFGGEALEPRRLRSWFARHGDRQPTLVNMYGITETTVHVTFRALGEADGERGSVIGVPIPDLYLQILDGEGEPVPLGVPGEIHVGGAGLARGYLGRPELTAQRFVPDPFGPWPGARLYASGDLARRRPDGELEYLGRADQQVKIRGFRIEPGEIEATLAQHPAVREAVVLAHGSQGEKRLVAYLGTGGAAAPGVEELRVFLRERLPEHMVPAVFVALASLPLTAHGKIDRRALPEPDAVRPGLGAGYTAPRTPEEAALAEVWAEVLEVDRVGVHDNFFALGGDSIRSIRVLSLAEKRGLRLSLPQIFQYQTIAELVPHRLAEPAGEAADAAPSGPFAGLAAPDLAALPGDVEDAYPLSQLQMGMLFHSAYSPESLAYHNVTTFHLQGEIAPQALRRALARLASRHPVLRTSFDLNGFSQPLQLVHREVEIPLGVEDLRGLSPQQRTAAVQARFEAEKAHRFDWTRAPLVRFHLQLLGAGEVQLTWAEHHAILDGWSVAALLADLFRLYRAELAGDAPPAPPPVRAFGEFVALEQRALVGTADRDYWSARLADRTSLRLPRWPGGGAPDGVAGGARVRSVQRILPASLVEGLGELAASAEVPLKSVLLAAHLRTIGELLGSRDVLTGLVANGRPESAGAEQALGLFLNTVPFRLRELAGSWHDLAREAFRLELELMPHRRYPMAELQRRLGAGEPLFEISFNYVHFHVLQGVTGLTLLDSEDVAETNFPLAVSFSRAIDGSRLRLALQYDTRELHAAQVEGFAELYLRALAALAREPAALCRETPLLAAPQRHQLLSEWNDTAAPFPADRCLHELVEEQVDRAPGAVAVEWEEGALTYRELDRRANRVAHRLRALGVGPETRVGLCVERSPGMMVGLLAVLKAGGAFVPLDPEYPGERLAFMIEDSGPRVLLSQRHLSGALPELGLPKLDLDAEALAGGRGDRLEHLLGPDQAAYVIYTSGSTGRPKGVEVAHRGVVNRLAWAQRTYPVTAADRVLQKAAFSFDFSVWECFAPLLAGARVVLARPGGHKDPAYLVSTIRERGITLVHFVPSMLKAFLAQEGIEQCRSLRFVFSGGETLPLDVQEMFFARVPATLRNQYGPTEITIDVADWICRPGDPSRGSVPIGRPLANGAMLVLNDVLDPVPPGVAGDLYLGGPGVARGYRNRPGLTAERFIPHPFASRPGERLYRTGDRARHFPDGNVEFLGRLDDQVKVRGFRIELGEVEAALLAHPALREAAVVARRDAGAQEARLVAYVVPRGAEAPAAGELRGFLRQTLPDYMLPALFVPLAALPLSVNGKLDRRALPAPEESARKAGAAPVPPRDELEGQLLTLWEEVLGLSPLGVQDDFHELGGHSLTAVRLMVRIEKALGVRLPVSSVFEAATVERLAALLRGGQAPGRRPLLVPLQGRGKGRPLFLVHPIGGNLFCYRDLVRGLGADRPVYGLQAVPDGAPAALESLACRYLEAVREVQPEGPYLLGGWSLGGTIAYEMARQLEGSGEGVALLAMIDTAAPAAVEDPGDAALLVRLAADLVRLSGRPVSQGPEVLAGLDLAAGLDRLLMLGRAEGILPPDLEIAQLQELFDVFRRLFQAARGYSPGGYGGRVAFFRAGGSVPPGTEDPTFGWQRLAATDLHLMDGDHYSLLRAPQVAVLAAALNRLAAQVQKEV